jgi:hypothetical protein
MTKITKRTDLMNRSYNACSGDIRPRRTGISPGTF